MKKWRGAAKNVLFCKPHTIANETSIIDNVADIPLVGTSARSKNGNYSLMRKHSSFRETSGAARELQVADVVGQYPPCDPVQTVLTDLRPLLEKVGICRV